MDLGLYDMAVRWAQRLGGAVDTARIMAQAKRLQGESALAAGDTAAALKLLGESCRLLRRAKDFRGSFALLQQHPQLASRAGMTDKVSAGSAKGGTFIATRVHIGCAADCVSQAHACNSALGLPGF